MCWWISVAFGGRHLEGYFCHGGVPGKVGCCSLSRLQIFRVKSVSLSA